MPAPVEPMDPPAEETEQGPTAEELRAAALAAKQAAKRAAERALEAHTKASLETYELTTNINGVNLHVRPEAGHVGVSYKIEGASKNGMKGFITPRMDMLGLFDDGIGYSVQADAGVTTRTASSHFSVGLNTGEHFRMKKDGISANGKSDYSGFIASESNTGISARLDTNGKVSVGLKVQF